MIIIYTDEFKKFGTEQDLKKLLAIFTAKNIPHRLEENARLADKISETSLSAERKSSKELTTKQKLIYEDGILKLFLQQTQGLSSYFIFEPKKLSQSQHREQLFDDSVTAFITFLKKKGFLQYCILQNQKNNCVKLLPVPASGNIVDINSKVVNNLRFFFGEHSLVNFDVLPNLDNNTGPRCDKRFAALSYPRTNFWTHIEALDQNVNHSIMSFLFSHNIIQFDSQHDSVVSSKTLEIPIIFTKSSPNKTQDVITIKKIKREALICAFCSPDIIKKQLVLDLGGFLLLVNYQPYAGAKAHFLIVPTHIEDWSHLDRPQRETLSKIVKGVTKSIQANCGIAKEDILSYVQNGVTAGQTVPGSHLHIFSKPNLFSYLTSIAYEMIGQRAVFLTPDEMAAIALKFKSEILQSLWSECSPARFQIDPPAPQMMLNAYSKHKALEKEKLSRSVGLGHDKFAVFL